MTRISSADDIVEAAKRFASARRRVSVFEMSNFEDGKTLDDALYLVAKAAADRARKDFDAAVASASYDELDRAGLILMNEKDH